MPSASELYPADTDVIDELFALGSGQDALTRVSAIVALWASFALALTGLDRASLWTDEAWSIWVAQQPLPILLRTVAADVHPPLYFVLLKGWIALSGESAFATRFLSTLFGIVGLAITFALGRKLLGRWSGLIALFWLGAHGFLLYYMRETRMYSLLFALAAFAMWSYWRWLKRPTSGRMAAYAGASTALAYVHYFGLLIPATQALHLVLTHRRRLRSWLLTIGGALCLFLPWVFVFAKQASSHPAGAHLSVTPTDWASVRQMLWIISGGAGLLVLLPFALGRGLPRLLRRPDSFSLLLLWTLLTPLALFALNTWVVPLYEARYVIGVLPAVGILIAYGLRHMSWRPLGVLLFVLLLNINLNQGAALRPAKAPWAEAVKEVIALRKPHEPTLLKIVEPSSLEAYYTRVLPLLNADTQLLRPTPYPPDEMRALVRALPPAEPVWLIMPDNITETWVALAELMETRHVGVRNAVDYMLFYRFDPGSTNNDLNNLTFTFGDRFRYLSDPIAQPVVMQPGEPFCMTIPLRALAPVDDEFSFGLHLVDGGGRLLAQVDAGLGAHSLDDILAIDACFDTPFELPAATYALHLVIYTWDDGRRLPVLENGVRWGDLLVVAVVDGQLAPDLATP